jgi:hypothetical protein
MSGLSAAAGAMIDSVSDESQSYGPAVLSRLAEVQHALSGGSSEDWLVAAEFRSDEGYALHRPGRPGRRSGTALTTRVEGGGSMMVMSSNVTPPVPIRLREAFRRCGASRVSQR